MEDIGKMEKVIAIPKAPVMKSLDLNGEIIQNCDYGIGYTIVWNNLNSKQVTGTSINDMLNIIISQCDFINNSKYRNNKYTILKEKLQEALKEFNK